MLVICKPPTTSPVVKPFEHQQQVPLQSVAVSVRISACAAFVTATQTYANAESAPVEAVYVFPIEEDAAVHSFKAVVDDREIESVLKPKKEAQREYSDALARGSGAYLMEQNDASRDMFIVSVGGLQPQKQCKIVIEYSCELDVNTESNSIRFVLPTAIAPRYNPSAKGVTGPADTNAQYVSSTPYSLEFSCTVDGAGNVAAVSSPSHPMSTEIISSQKIQLSLSNKGTHLDRDLIVDVRMKVDNANRIGAQLFVESCQPGKETVAMLCLVPPVDDGKQVEAADTELVFVVDCSGSMEEEGKIDYARQAMLVFLKSIPLNFRFNIVRFGSSYAQLFPQSRIYSEESAAEAKLLIDNLSANMGGTELLQPLLWLFSQPPQAQSRQIFLLTDGEISNVTEVMDECRKASKQNRIFSFGLGSSPSRALVKGLARTTFGKAMFIPPNTDVDVPVAHQLNRALQPCFADLRIEWNLPDSPEEFSIEACPSMVPPVFRGDRFCAYAIVDAGNSPGVIEARVFRGAELLVAIRRNVAEDVEFPLSKLAGRALLRELQEQKFAAKPSGSVQQRFAGVQSEAEPAEAWKKRQEDKMLGLSLKYSVLCPLTGFVAVEKRKSSDANNGMQLREVPIEVRRKEPGSVAVRSSGGRGGFGRPSGMLGGGCRIISAVRRSSSVAPAAPSKCAVDLLAANTRTAFSTAGSKRDAAYDAAQEAANFEDDAEMEQKRQEGDNSAAVLRNLISLQRFDGSWHFSDVPAMGISLPDARNTFSGLSVDIWTTILVYSFLQHHYETSPLWKPIAAKSLRFLKSQKLDCSVESLLEAGKKLVLAKLDGAGP
eukprot:ANDGO_03272.mRNA.1 von Willebrand factor A domain-containing protein DDB_G0292028